MLVSPARSRFVRVLFPALLFGALILGGCKLDQDIAMDFDYSVNVFRPGPKFPNHKKLKPSEKELFDRYGKPDFIRVYWNRDGDLRTRNQLQGELQGKKPKKMPPYAWLYLKQGREYFINETTFEERPVTERVRIICEHGDPEDIKDLMGGRIQWTYYSTGRIFTIVGDRVVDVKEFPAMGRFNRR